MATLIICAGRMGMVLGSPGDFTGHFLRDYDPDAMEGVGAVSWTPDVGRAKRFDSMLDALAEWKRQSTVKPLRDDGMPNRPLTTFSITFADVD